MTTVSGTLATNGESQAISVGIDEKLNVTIEGTFDAIVTLEEAAGTSGWITRAGTRGRPTSFDDIRGTHQYRVVVSGYVSGSVNYTLITSPAYGSVNPNGPFSGDLSDIDFDPGSTGLPTDPEQAIIQIYNSLPKRGIRTLPNWTTFDEDIAGLAPNREYLFGTAAESTLPYQLAIRNITDLDVYWNPYHDYTGRTVINSELQNYQPFNTSNHAFVSDRLNLTGLLPGGSWTTQVYQVGVTPVNLNGTAIPIANLGMANTDGLRVGQLVAVQYRGIYYISAMVADTSISLTQLGGSTTGTQTGNLIVFLPIDSATLSAQHTGGTDTMTFATLPAGIALNTTSIGYATSSQPRNMNNDYRVIAITGSGPYTVQLSSNTNFGTIGAGTRILFIPSITSGQMWSDDLYDMTNPQSFFAFDMDCHLYEGADTTNPYQMNTIAAYNALPATVPMGCWPTAWTYQGNNGQDRTVNSAEWDFFEGYVSTTIGLAGFVMNNVAGDTTTIFSKNNAGWSSSSGVYRRTTTLSGARRISFIYSGGRTYRYIDGEKIKIDKTEWVSQMPMQVGVNLALGTVAPGNGSNLTLPFRPENFTGAKYGIKRIGLWHIQA